jgi:hypothetical protein
MTQHEDYEPPEWAEADYRYDERKDREVEEYYRRLREEERKRRAEVDRLRDELASLHGYLQGIADELGLSRTTAPITIAARACAQIRRSR